MNGMFSPHTPDFPDFMYLDFIGDIPQIIL